MKAVLGSSQPNSMSFFSAALDPMAIKKIVSNKKNLVRLGVKLKMKGFIEKKLASVRSLANYKTSALGFKRPCARTLSEIVRCRVSIEINTVTNLPVDFFRR